MPELKPIRNLSIKQQPTDFVEQELLTELYKIEKEIAEFRKEQDKLDSSAIEHCTVMSEKENKLDRLIRQHCAVMRKLRILWTHNILEKIIFHMLYGNGNENNGQKPQEIKDLTVERVQGKEDHMAYTK